MEKGSSEETIVSLNNKVQDLEKEIEFLKKSYKKIGIYKRAKGARPDNPDKNYFTADSIRNYFAGSTATTNEVAPNQPTSTSDAYSDYGSDLEIVSTTTVPNDIPRTDRYAEMMTMLETVLEVDTLDECYSAESFKDISSDFLDIRDQDRIKSCTAHAATSVIEYFINKCMKNEFKTSVNFTYKTTRNYMKEEGDNGATLGATIAALRLCGCVEYTHWSDEEHSIYEEPTPFVYSLAQNFKAIRFMKLDSPTTPRHLVINRIKRFIDAGVPVIFTFTAYDHVQQNPTWTSGIIQPYNIQTCTGADFHAVVAVGYKDMKYKDARKNMLDYWNNTSDPEGPSNKLKIVEPDGQECDFHIEGYIKIRNSWGTIFGDEGYGYLPYNYVMEYLANNFWVILQTNWIKGLKRLQIVDTQNIEPRA